jgi:type III secretion protein C
MDSTVTHRVRTGLAAILIAACSCWIGASALAAEVPWPNKGRFQYMAQKKDLRELLREFAISQGITVSVAEGVEGNVSGKFDLKPQAMLDLLAASHGFLWYYDGSLLHITPAGNVRTEVIQLRYGTIEQLQATLARLGILDRRFPLHVDSDGSSVVVSGPARYVELVLQVADNFDGKQGRTQATEVRVFPLRFAWAADHEFSSGGQTVVVSGVASVLRSMYQGGTPSSRRDSRDVMPKLPPMKSPRLPTGMPGNEPPPVQSAISASKSPASAAALAGASADPANDFPMIQADPRINAVLVRDISARMPQYEALIRALDVRPAMIEIEAHIIEVSSEEAEKLGVDWRLNSTPTANAGNSLPRLNDVRNFGFGGVMRTVLQNAGLNLMERIAALAEQGKANVVASPSVLTLNNLEARMDNQESFYVKVAGYQSAELYNITTGVILRVTPMIVKTGDQQRIKLDVRIEDGKINDRTVDQIPIVKRSEINTQGFVNDGEALLIAGYAVEQETRGNANVPGLSQIPIVGALFRHEEMRKSKIQRLFLLTPRIVGDDSNASRAAQAVKGVLNRDGAPAVSMAAKLEDTLVKKEADKAAAEKAAAEKAPEPKAGDKPAANTTAAAAVAAAPAAAAQIPIPAWDIAVADKTLKAAITRWATSAGWQLSWELPVDYAIEARMSIPGTFEDAVAAVANSMAKTETPMKAIFYKTNKVLRIVAKGAE